MTALATNTLDKRAQRGRTRSYVVKTSQALYANGLVGLDANGLVVPWDDTAITQRFLGVFVGWDRPSVTTGNTSASLPVRAIVDVSGAELANVDVVGVTARANIGEPVYSTTDNPTDLTLTPTAFVKPIGRLVDFRTTSDMDVELFTPTEYHAYGSFYLKSQFINLATLANADVITDWTPGHRGRVVKWWFETMVAVTTGAKAATLNLEVGTTNMTGGTIALAGTYAHGAIQAQAAVFTAGTAFGPTDTLAVEASSVTTFVEGNGTLHILIQSDE